MGRAWSVLGVRLIAWGTNTQQWQHRFQVLQFVCYLHVLLPFWVANSGLVGLLWLSKLEMWLEGAENFNSQTSRVKWNLANMWRDSSHKQTKTIQELFFSHFKYCKIIVFQASFPVRENTTLLNLNWKTICYAGGQHATLAHQLSDKSYLQQAKKTRTQP